MTQVELQRRGANDCVDIADGYPGIVPVRDSKAPHARPLIFSAAPWALLVERLKN